MAAMRSSPPSRWRQLAIDWPARIVGHVWYAYWLIVAIVTILCFVNVALWVLLYLLGVPLP